MKYPVIPNLHPSAVIRNRNKWSPIFNQAFDQVKAFLNSINPTQNQTQGNDTKSNHTINYIIASNDTFYDLLDNLRNQGYKLVDVQRYKDLHGDQVIDQGLFAIFKNDDNQYTYVILNNVKMFYYKVNPNKQSPEPLLYKHECELVEGPSLKDVLINRWKALKLSKYEVYYNVDFPLDDWVVYQIKERIPGEPNYNIAFFDIEVYADVFPNERDAKFPISTISCIIGDQFYQLINKEVINKELDLNKVQQHIKENNVEIENFSVLYYDSEVDMLKDFARLLKENHVDVLTAWNIYFDINYIANRCKVLGIDTAIFSPIAKPMYPSGRFGFHIIPGYIIIDMLELFKSYESNEPKYTLDYIANKVLGKRKVKFEGDLYELHTQDPEKFIAYSAVDTKLIQLIESKRGNIALHLMLKDLAWISYLNSYLTMAQIDGLMYQYAHRENKVLRMKPFNAEKTQAFTGGFVREPRTGYIPWAIDLDASSMYPSIIISLNLSPETFVGYIELQPPIPSMEAVLLSDEYDDYEVSVIVNPNKQQFIKEERVTIKVRDLKQKIYSGKDFTISLQGTIFSLQQKGFIPKILEDLIKQRKQYKNKALRLLASTDPEERMLGIKYNIIQKALKVLANAIYGAMGNVAFRFFDTRLSSTITSTGQYEVKFVSGIAERFTKLWLEGKVSKPEDYEFELTSDIVRQAEGKQYYVFYSDTDSSFIDIFEKLADVYIQVANEFKDKDVKSIIKVYYKKLQNKEDISDCPLHPIVVKMFGERLSEAS